MNTVTISNDNMAVTIYRYAQTDFPPQEQNLQENPVEVVVNVSAQKSRLWFANREEFNFFAEAISSYLEDFKKGGTT